MDQIPVFIPGAQLLLSLVVPLLGRAWRRSVFPVAALGVAVSALASALTLDRVMESGPFRYWMGGWEPPVGIAKKRQRLTKLKEIRMQPKIDSHDLDFKSKHIKTFLDQGNKVKVTVRFRGRELAHTEIGRAVLDRVVERTREYAVLTRSAQMEGRFMSLVLSPKSRK